MSKTKWLIGILGIAVIITAIYLIKPNLQKGLIVRYATGPVDLTIQSLTITPATPGVTTFRVGEGATLAATVVNRGTGRARGSTLLFTITPENTTLTASVQPLNPNATHTVSQNIILGAEGRLNVRACADQTNLIRETDEKNNCSSVSVVVEAQPLPLLPDLEVQLLSVGGNNPSVQLIPGTEIWLRTREANSGSIASGASTLQILTDSDGDTSTWETAETTLRSSFTGEAVVEDSFALTWRPAEPGTYNFKVCMDALEEIAESNEENNCSDIYTVTVMAITETTESGEEPEDNIVDGPIITRSPTPLSTNAILQTMQDVAIFDITAPASERIYIHGLSVLCAGAGVSNVELNDNAIEIRVDGILQASSPENSATCAFGNGRAHTFGGLSSGFATPIEIAAGTTKSILIKMDTYAQAGQWSTGESLIIRIAGDLLWSTDRDTFTWQNTSSSYPVDGPILMF